MNELIYLDREGDPVKLSKIMRRELTQSLVYYIVNLKSQIYNEQDRAKKQALRERLFVANKLYYLFEQPSVRVKTNLEFHRNWERFSNELLKSKLQFS